MLNWAYFVSAMWWSDLTQVLTGVHYKDLLDLFLVWLLVYRILLLVKKSGATQILAGLGVLALAYLLSIWVPLATLNWLLEKFFNNLFLIVVVLFQAEIRRALAQIGSNPFLSQVSPTEETHVVEEIGKGAMALAQKGYGALIVIEREIALDYFVELGKIIDAKVSTEMFASIFHPASPLHDGAIIIRGGMIHAAGCFLPLSKNPVLDRNLGTRHRAALGLTEETDAFVLVVSEETHTVSMVQGGTLSPDVDHPTLRKKLYEVFALKARPMERRATP